VTTSAGAVLGSGVLRAAAAGQRARSDDARGREYADDHDLARKKPDPPQTSHLPVVT
jgi:hypothetical protein